MAGVWSIVVPQLSEYTNLCANPSFETGSTGYTGIGGLAVRTIGSCTNGAYKMTVTPAAGVNDGVYYGTVSLTTGTTYTFSIDLKATAAIPYKIYFAATDGTLKGTATEFTGNTSNYARESVSWACDSTASYRLYIVKNNHASVDDFYIDALSVIATSSEITYFDGDTANCRWSGVAHGSTSIASAQARNVGVITDLQDYNLRVLTMDGVNTAPSTHHVTPYAMRPGAEYNGHKVQPRYITLTNATYGTSLENLHSKRKSIVNLFKHDLTAGDQPITLRYTGANASRPLQITCYLLQEIGQFDQQKIQRNAIQLVCYDPYFYDVTTEATSLVTYDSGTRKYFAAKRNGAWTTITPSAVTDPGSGIKVRDIELKGGYLAKSPFSPPGEPTPYYTTSERIYVSGYYLNWNGTAASDYICYYDVAAGTWNAVEAATNGYVRSMSIAPNGYIYACGEFTQIGSTSANRIAYWDGDSWEAMGDGFGGIAYDVLVGNDGKVYAVGNDTTIGGVADAAYVAYWDGTAWQKMATGLNAVAYVLDKDNAGNIYIGGTQTGYVTKWDGAAFTSLGAPSICWGLKVAPNGNLYAGMAGSEYIKMWNGQAWVSMGGGITTGSFTYSMDIDADGLLWVAGDFSAVGGLTVRGLACWNGYSWVHPDIQLPASTIVYTVKCNGNDIYLGFDTETADSTFFSEQNTVTNPGTARIYPVYSINRNAGTSAQLRYLRNETTGAALYFDYDMQDGETVSIDLREGLRSVTSSYYGDIWRAVLRGSNFADFYLLPGANTISEFVYSVGSPQITSNVKYSSRHESIDGAAA